jgi:hypothetical protein
VLLAHPGADERREGALCIPGALCAIDIRYALSGRIAKTYLADAAAQALVLAAWLRFRLPEDIGVLHNRGSG